MSAALIEALLSTVLTLVQNTGVTSTAINNVITTLEKVIPVLVQEYADLKPIVVNIINLLKSNGEVTTEQLDTLDILEAQIDADVNTAISDYEKNHPESN